MENARPAPEWAKFTELFNRQFEGRATRLGVFERDRDQTTDYWIESGLPLVHVNVDERGPMPSVEILVGNLSHRIVNTVRLSFTFSPHGTDNGLDVVDSAGRTTVLRFEQK